MSNSCRKCQHCKKPLPINARSTKRYCSEACKKAAMRKEKPKAAAARNKAKQEVFDNPLNELFQTYFMKEVVMNCVRHKSIDCLLDFPIEELFTLWCDRGKLSYLTGSRVDISHLTSLKHGGAYHPTNLTLLPASLNQSLGKKSLPLGVGFTPKTKCDTATEAKAQLLKRFRPILTTFAKKHKNLAGGELFRSAKRIVGCPESPFKTASSLHQLNPEQLKELCSRLGVKFEQRKTRQRTGDNLKPPMIIYLYHFQRMKPRATGKGLLSLDKLCCLLELLIDVDVTPYAIARLAVEGHATKALEQLIELLKTTDIQIPDFNVEAFLMNYNKDRDFLMEDGSIIRAIPLPYTPDTDECDERRLHELPPDFQQMLIEAGVENHKAALKNVAYAEKLAKQNNTSPVYELEQARSKFENPHRYEHAMTLLKEKHHNEIDA